MISYNIQFPLRDNSSTNSFVFMTQVTKEAYSSDLLLLLLTQKGERYYDPEYGCDLLKFIFEQNDGLTATDVEAEIKSTVSKYIPNLKVTAINFNWNVDAEGNPISENQLSVRVFFTYTEDSFSESGQIDINF